MKAIEHSNNDLVIVNIIQEPCLIAPWHTYEILYMSNFAAFTTFNSRVGKSRIQIVISQPPHFFHRIFCSIQVSRDHNFLPISMPVQLIVMMQDKFLHHDSGED